MATQNWALTQISQLLPLDEESLKQVLEYSSTLSKEASAEHLKNLLGDSPRALEFISSFNSRRDAPNPTLVARPTEAPESSQVPHKQRKKKPPLNRLPPPRQVQQYGDVAGAYQKKDEKDYMSGSQKPRKDSPSANSFSLSDIPSARQLPATIPSTSVSSHKLPPSASGSLISDLPNVRTSSRTASPAPKAKVNIAGGSSMRGASTTLQDLVS